MGSVFLAADKVALNPTIADIPATDAKNAPAARNISYYIVNSKK